jgi:predicted flap endonuclease-1-like 5' DNA nuclease
MQQLLTDYPWLVILGAVLLGMLVMWLLEMFVLRRNIKTNLTELDASLKQRDAELKTAQASLTETNASLKSKTGELQTVSAARAAADGQVADLTAQLNKTNADLAAAQQSGQEFETNLNTRTAELADQRAKYAALAAKADESGAQVNTLTGERDQLRDSLATTQSELNDNKAQYRSALAEVAKLGAVAAATAAVVKGLEGSKSELTAEVERLNGVLNETNTAKANVETELSNNKLRLADLESVKTTLEGELTDLQGVKTTLEGQVADLEGRNSALDADIAKLTAGALAAAAVIKQLEDEKSNLTTSHTELQGQYDELRRSKALDDAELAEVKLNLSQVNTALGITTRDKEAYQQTLSERVTELGNAQSDLARTKEDNTGLLADVARFTARAAAAAALAQELEGNKRDLSREVEQLRAELDSEHERAAASSQNPNAAEQPSAPAGELASESTPQTLLSNGGDTTQDALHPEPNGDAMSSNEPVMESAPMAVGSNGAEAELAPVAALAAAPAAEAHHDESMMALESACPQDLTVVSGIGPEFEQRLYKAGVGTYWDLSQKSEEDLASILNLGDAHHLSVNLAAIRGDALQLARETKSQKRTWTGGVPDDFDMLPGIGKTYEGRLYAAGICTFEALAGASVEQLAGICQAPHLSHSHYQTWIDEARLLVTARRKGL